MALESRLKLSVDNFNPDTDLIEVFSKKAGIVGVIHPNQIASPSGVAGAIQFSNGSAFASDATNFFWDNTNKRLGVGTNAPDSKFQLSTSGSTGFRIDYGGSGNGNNYIDAGVASAGFTYLRCRTEISAPLSVNLTNGYNLAMFSVKGSGSTSATTSLLVQNSAGSESVRTRDDGITMLGYTGISSVASGASIINLGGSNVLQVGNSIASNQFMVIDSVSGSQRGIKFGNQGTIRMALIQDNDKLQIGDFASTFNPLTTFAYSTLNVGIGTATPTASSILDVTSTTRGFLPPRMTTTQKNAIATPAAGLMVYDTTLNKLCVYTTAWETITSI